MKQTFVMFSVGWPEADRTFCGVKPSVGPMGHLVLTDKDGATVAAFAPGVWAGFMVRSMDEGGNA